jgi:hypothetical protein
LVVFDIFDSLSMVLTAEYFLPCGLWFAVLFSSVTSCVVINEQVDISIVQDAGQSLVKARNLKS